MRAHTVCLLVTQVPIRLDGYGTRISPLHDRLEDFFEGIALGPEDLKLKHLTGEKATCWFDSRTISYRQNPPVALMHGNQSGATWERKTHIVYGLRIPGRSCRTCSSSSRRGGSVSGITESLVEVALRVPAGLRIVELASARTCRTGERWSSLQALRSRRTRSLAVVSSSVHTNRLSSFCRSGSDSLPPSHAAFS